MARTIVQMTDMGMKEEWLIERALMELVANQAVLNEDPANALRFSMEEHNSRREVKLGLPQIRFHDVRHTYATLARRSGMDIKDLSVRLGHENVATTMNLYQHIPVDMARESARSVADYILG